MANGNQFKIFLFDISNTADFQQKVQDVREKFKIPANGCPKNVRGYYPINWTEENANEVFIEAKKIAEEYELYDWRAESAIHWYIFFNDFDFSTGCDMNGLLDDYPFCLIIDIPEVKKNTILEKDKQGDYEVEDPIWDKAFPIGLRISPHASQKAIIQHIKKHWELISCYQNRYKKLLKINQLRTKRVAERDAFIYQNKDKPRKLIIDLVAEKFSEYLDMGHIGKIISLEKAKRGPSTLAKPNRFCLCPRLHDFPPFPSFTPPELPPIKS